MMTILTKAIAYETGRKFIGLILDRNEKIISRTGVYDLKKEAYQAAKELRNCMQQEQK